MPKKYLIYVHDDERFDKLTGRGEKSGLVNELLNQHWAKPAKTVSTSGGKLVVDGKIPVLPGQTKLIKTKSDVAKVVAKKSLKADDVCKHGAAPGFCKYAKCPNSRRQEA